MNENGRVASYKLTHLQICPFAICRFSKGVFVYSSIQPSRLYEQIVAQIQKSIVEGKLQPGDKLPPERELGEQFGVSRTAVREAVKALREKGLVEIWPGKGTYVSDIISSTSGVVRDSLGVIVAAGLSDGMLDLVQVREILEAEIAAVAAEKATEKEIQIMQDAIAVMDEAMDDVDRYIKADLEFHLALAKSTQNPLISILIDPIIDLLQEQRRRIFLVEGGPQRGQIYHKQILEALIEHDSSAAHKAMVAHLDQVRQDSGLAMKLVD
jgi:GntR family transcriptional repressor for pyruvate dehydrogenase complex